MAAAEPCRRIPQRCQIPTGPDQRVTISRCPRWRSVVAARGKSRDRWQAFGHAPVVPEWSKQRATRSRCPGPDSPVSRVPFEIVSNGVPNRGTRSPAVRRRGVGKNEEIKFSKAAGRFVPGLSPLRERGGVNRADRGLPPRFVRHEDNREAPGTTHLASNPTVPRIAVVQSAIC